MSDYSNLKLKSDIIYQVNEDGMMIYVPEEGMIHAVNITAADIILFIEGGNNSIELLVDKFLEKYVGISKEVLYDDVRSILNSLVELEIIQGA